MARGYLAQERAAQPVWRIGRLLAGLALALALAGCAAAGHGSATTGGRGAATPVPLKLTCAQGAVVCVKTIVVGADVEPTLATTSGMTLYYSTADTPKFVTCTDDCARTWPPLTTPAPIVTGSGLAGGLSSFTSANGYQVTFEGHPLYTYSGDHSPADARGEGLQGAWYIATIRLAATAPAGGNGYFVP